VDFGACLRRELRISWNNRADEKFKFSERFEAQTMGGLGFYTSRRAARWGNARHRPKHAATRLPPAEAPEAHA
jgi:hypothetical protein